MSSCQGGVSLSHRTTNEMCPSYAHMNTGWAQEDRKTSNLFFKYLNKVRMSLADLQTVCLQKFGTTPNKVVSILSYLRSHELVSTLFTGLITIMNYL